jgi:ribosomal protein L7/L12
MSPAFNIAEQTALAQGARLLLDAGVEPEVVLGVLRKGGLGLLNSIKVWSELTGIPLVEAQKVVQKSRAWQHTFEKDAELQGRIAEAAAALREEQHG